jgi:hypothetical protein
MGPRGRVGVTAVIAVWLVCGFFVEFLLTWLCQLVLLSWILVGVWRKGWAISIGVPILYRLAKPM